MKAARFNNKKSDCHYSMVKNLCSNHNGKWHPQIPDLASLKLQLTMFHAPPVHKNLETWMRGN